MTFHTDPIHFVSALKRAPGGDRSLAKASHIPRPWPEAESAPQDVEAYRRQALALRSEALRTASLPVGRWLAAAARMLWSGLRRVLAGAPIRPASHSS